MGEKADYGRLIPSAIDPSQRDHLETVLERLTTILERNDQVSIRARARLRLVVDEHPMPAGAQNQTHITLAAQTRSPELIERVLVSLPAPGTLVLGVRQIPLPAGVWSFEFGSVLNHSDARELWIGTPNNPGVAGSLWLELMGTEQPDISL